MINSDVLLFPDTGPDFVRSLKTAVLYSERVYVLTLHPRVLPRLLGTAMEDPTLSQLREKVHGRERLIRSAEYSRFMMAHIKELNLLISEEVLLPVSFGPIGLFHLSDEDQDKFDTRLQLATAPLLKAFRSCPPSLFDLLVLAYEPEARDDSLKEIASSVPFCFLHYLLMLASIAEKNKIPLSSWSFEYQNAMWAVRECFTPLRARKFERRSSVQSQLGYRVLERHIPNVEDLPFEEILDLRRRYAPELQSLRVGVAELAVQIDPTQAPENGSSLGTLLTSWTNFWPDVQNPRD